MSKKESSSKEEQFKMDALDETPTVEIQKKGSYFRETDQSNTCSRPWVRFWARMIDYVLFMGASSIFSGYFDLNLKATNPYSWTFVIFLWVFIEAFLLKTVGYTPGKWFLRVRILDKHDQKLSLSESLNRSLSVWWLGMGAGVFIVSWITMIVAAVKLSNTGMTSWDRRSELHVSHGRVGIFHVVAMIFFFLCYVWFAR